MESITDIYEECCRIRSFEKGVERAFSKGMLRGTTHGCIGQEIIPVLAMRHVARDLDFVVGTHRCHGQVIAYTHAPYRLIAEMMGKRDGFVQGMGGSQHVKTGRYMTNGVTGGMSVVGCGIAMAMKLQKSDGIVVSFLGDGGFNEGYVQEGFQLAAHFSVPLLYICENNRYAMSTPTQKYSAGNFAHRIQALGMHYIHSSTSDVEQLSLDMENAFQHVRQARNPCFLEVETARLCGHSKSDCMEYMSEEEKERDQKNDPVAWMERQMPKENVAKIQRKIEKELQDMFERAARCPELAIEKSDVG